MSKRIITTIFETVAVLLWSLYSCWLFVQPVFWTLSGPVSSFWEAIEKIIFREDGQGLIIGGGIDLIGTLWIFSNARSIFEGEQHTVLSEIYAPIGFDLGMNTGFAWADAALSWPLMNSLGEPQFYNTHILFTLILSQIGTYILLRSWKTPVLIALLLMSFVVLNPFTIEEIYQGRPTQVHIFFHTLFLWSITKITTGKGWRWSFLGAFSLACACLVYWFSGAAVGFCGIILYLFYGKWRSLPQFIALGIGAIMLVLSATWRVSKDFIFGSGGMQFAQLRRPPADEIQLGFMNIPIQKWQYIQKFADISALLEGLYFPSILLIAALIASLMIKHRIRSIVFVFIAITIPIEGAIVFNNGSWIPTGYAFLHSIFPPLPRCTVPHRMMVAPLLISLLMIGMGSHALISKIRSWSVRWGLILLFLAGIYQTLMQSIPASQKTSTSRHAVDQSYIKYSQKYPGGIIDVPLIASEKTYVQQRHHKQKIIGGPGQDSVRPHMHRLYYQRNSYLLALESMAEKGKVRTIKEKDKIKLWNDGFRLLVIHMNMSRATQEEYETLLGVSGELDLRKNRLYIPILEP